MKTLEQLGISPAPWTKAGDIVDDNEGHVIFLLLFPVFVFAS